MMKKTDLKTKHLSAINNFAKSFELGYRTIIELPPISDKEALKKYATLTAASILILKKSIDNNNRVNTIIAIGKAIEIVDNNCLDNIDFLIVWRAVNIIIEGEQYLAAPKNKMFVVRNNFENFVTVNVLPYE